jgi:hypothetical protein
MVALLVPVISAQQREVSRERTFEDLLVVVGLDHLNPNDKDKIENLVLSLNHATTTESREKASAFDSVVGFLQGQGFAPELVMSSDLDKQPILIVGRILRESTADIPDTLWPSNWKDGLYFVRWTDDGVSEIIVDGEVHDFTKSLWQVF